MEITPELIDAVYNTATQVVSPENMQAGLDRMANEIDVAMRDLDPIMLTVMNGGMIPAAELAKRLNFPMQMDYLHATRYCGETSGGQQVHWLKQPAIDLAGRNVLIVDDILDGGITLQAVMDYCRNMGAKSVKTAVMLDKPDARIEGGVAEADFKGLDIPNDYVFGMGLDYHDYLRNVPGIYAVAEQYR